MTKLVYLTAENKIKAQYIPGVAATHKWLYKNFGKANYCENSPIHIGKRFEWSNLSREYKRDISDWKQLCPSCHRKMDFTDAQRKRISQNRRGIPATWRNRMVAQFNSKGNQLSIYHSITEASQETGITRTGIMNTLAGRTLTSGGYKWQYVSGV